MSTLTNELFLSEALTVAVRQMRLAAGIEELFDPRRAADLRVIHKMAKMRDLKDRLVRETTQAVCALLED